MQTDYVALKKAVDDYLVEIGVAFSVVNAGVRTVQPETDKYASDSAPQRSYQQDAWRYTFNVDIPNAKSRNPPTNVMRGDYYTGTGHRVKPKAVFGWQKNVTPHTLAWEQNERLKVPVKPLAADVLYCLIREADANDSSFYDWANEFGFNTDSIKALNTYNQCCEIDRDLRRVFTREQRLHLQTLLEDL